MVAASKNKHGLVKSLATINNLTNDDVQKGALEVNSANEAVRKNLKPHDYLLPL